VPGYEGIVRNETADQLARTGSERACGISITVAKKAARGWTNRNHNNHWESVTGLRKAKGLLKLNRDQLRWVIGLLIGHCHLIGHLFKLGLADDPFFERCLKKMNQPHISVVIVRL
jgi:hypothetical protein